MNRNLLGRPLYRFLQGETRFQLGFSFPQISLNVVGLGLTNDLYKTLSYGWKGFRSDALSLGDSSTPSVAIGWTEDGGVIQTHQLKMLLLASPALSHRPEMRDKRPKTPFLCLCW